MRIVVVDDDTLVAMSLKTILEAKGEFTVVATGDSGEEAIRLYRKHQPEILLLDIQMKGMSGLEAASQILTEFPEAKILFLTTFSDDEYIVKALHMRAKGYILKQDFEGIATALSAVAGGQSVFGVNIVDKIPDLLQSREAFDYREAGITEKEEEIIEMVAKGLNNKELAEILCFSEGTIRNYLSSILEKLQLRDRTQLAIFWYQHQQ